VSHFPFLFFDETRFYDSKGEELNETLEELAPSFYDLDKEMSLGDDVLDPLPFDEAIQAIDAPARQEVNMVSYFPFQDFDDALFYDLESEEVLEDPLDALSPSCYDKGSDIVDNIDEFINVGRCKWDVMGSNVDTIYDMEGHFQMLHLQLSYEVTNDSDISKQGTDIVTYISKGDLALFYPTDFRSYREDYDEYSFDHLDLFYEEYYQPPLFLDLDRGEDIAFPKQGTCDKVLHPPLITLPCYAIKGVVHKHVPCLEFYPRQSLLLESKGRLNSLKISLLSQSLSLSLRNCQSSSRFLLVLSQTSGYDNVQGRQRSDSLIRYFEPFIFHDPFMRCIEHFP
jgi:hypothetical protein